MQVDRGAGGDQPAGEVDALVPQQVELGDGDKGVREVGEVRGPGEPDVRAGEDDLGDGLAARRRLKAVVEPASRERAPAKTAALVGDRLAANALK